MLGIVKLLLGILVVYYSIPAFFFFSLSWEEGEGKSVCCFFVFFFLLNDGIYGIYLPS